MIMEKEQNEKNTVDTNIVHSYTWGFRWHNYIYINIRYAMVDKSIIFVCVME